MMNTIIGQLHLRQIKFKVSTVYDDFSILFVSPENSPEQSLDDKQVKESSKST